MKRFIQTFICVLSIGLAYGQIGSNGLVAYYPFSGNAYDESGNVVTHNGTVSGAALTTDRFNNSNSAYSFNGYSSVIQVNSFPQFFTSNFSISLWLKNTGNLGRTYDSFISMGTSMSNHSINYAYDRTNSNFSYWDITNWSYFFTSGANEVKDKWAHIVIVYENGIASNYVNGVKKSTMSVSGIVPRTSTTLNVGAFAPDAQYFMGSIDDIAIYNRALSTNEIISLLNANKCFQTVSVNDTLKIARITGYNTLPQDFGVLKVYPNPSRDVLTISTSHPDAGNSIKILNSSGQTVYTSTLGTASMQVNVSNLGSNGLYLIQILNIQNQIMDVRKLLLE